MKPTFLYFAILSCSIIALFGFTQIQQQETPSKEHQHKIEKVYDHQNRFVTDLKFVETKTGLIKKTINIQSLNPYTDLRFPLDHEEENGCKAFDVSNVETTAILSDYFPAQLEEKRNFEVYKFGLAKSFYQVVTINNYTLVSFELTFYGKEEGGIMGKVATLYAFDATGKLHVKLEDLAGGATEPVITADGRYLAFLNGDIANHVDASLLSAPGVKIFQVDNAQMIINQKGNIDMDIAPPSAFENLIVVVGRMRDGHYLYHVYKLQEGKLFTKKYTREEAGRVNWNDSYSFEIVHNDGHKMIERFDQDFVLKPY